MKFTGQFTGLKLDLQTWKARLCTYLEPKLHELVRVWLAAVTGRVPVWSGMSRASLLEVSEMVGGRIVISPKVNVKSRIPQGRALGTAEKRITDTDFTITIITRVPHYTYQEYKVPPKGGSPSAPWFSRAAGKAAFRNVARHVVLPPVIFKPVVKTF
jgi:hypothetical protein